MIKVRELREKRGMNQSQLAKASGITQATISRIESGQVLQLKSEAIKRLARCLGVTTDFLTGNSENMSVSNLIDADETAKSILLSYNALPDEGRKEIRNFVEWLEFKHAPTPTHTRAR